jgi:DNA-binding transcriptional LysR family regulator
MKNELDFALMNKRDISMNQLEMQPILKEKLYLVISDHMLAQYFPSEYPTCKESFQKGVDLAAFCDVPFVLNFRGFNSREIIEEHLQARGLQLKCAQELTQQDLHFMLAVRDYAACFCWAMYVPSIHQNNQLPSMGHLNVFPIKGLSATNQVVLVLPKGKILPAYSRDFIRLIRQSCTEFSGESVK